MFLSLSTSGDNETYLSSKMKTKRKICQIIIGYTMAQHSTQVWKLFLCWEVKAPSLDEEQQAINYL